MRATFTLDTLGGITSAILFIYFSTHFSLLSKFFWKGKDNENRHHTNTYFLDNNKYNTRFVFI
jgi:hypothetical protein